MFGFPMCVLECDSETPDADDVSVKDEPRLDDSARPLTPPNLRSPAAYIPPHSNDYLPLPQACSTPVRPPSIHAHRAYDTIDQARQDRPLHVTEISSSSSELSIDCSECKSPYAGGVRQSKTFPINCVLPKDLPYRQRVLRPWESHTMQSPLTMYIPPTVPLPPMPCIPTPIFNQGMSPYLAWAWSPLGHAQAPVCSTPLVSPPSVNPASTCSPILPPGVLAPVMPSLHDTLTRQHDWLMYELSCLQHQDPHNRWLQSISQVYSSEVEKLEAQRYQVLVIEAVSLEHRRCVSQHIDSQRLHLIHTIHSKVLIYKSAAGLGKLNTHTPSPPHQWASTPIHTPLQTSGTPSVTVNYNTSMTRPKYEYKSPENESGYGSLGTSPTTDTSESTTSPEIDDKDPKGKSCRRFLSRRSVQLMEVWYQLNFDHPYPNDAAVHQLAKDGNITITQIKKWMANKRVRSFNTLSFNGSVHPKKLRRLHRQQMLYTGQQSPLVEKPVISRTPNTPLSSRATQLLNKWFREHKENPYPTETDKQKLVKDTGMLMTQVKCWFANKRSRTNNTRKVSPSYVLELFNRTNQALNHHQVSLQFTESTSAGTIGASPIL